MTLFDHNIDTAKTKHKGKPILEQNGEFFTNADYNRISKKWQPEPKHISQEDIYGEMKKDMEGQIQKLTDQLQKILDTTTLVLNEYGTKAMESRTKMRETIQKQNGELMQLREKLGKLENEEEISKLKDRIKELEEQKPRKPGRPPKEKDS